MYFGFLMVLLGWTAFLSNALAFVSTPVFVPYIYRFQIHPEERALASRFDYQFLAYKTKVRRWV